MNRSLGDRLRNANVAAAALLPVRFVFGATFVFAGLDKLLSPDFFDPGAPGSIQSQFAIFERFSPLAPLVHLAEPYAVLVGLLIALGEVAVGLGALTGICYRLAALGGAALALLFVLTASWTVRPYYLGPDLPYAVGWLSLALAGHGDLLVWRPARAGAWSTAPDGADLVRRGLLQVGLLGVLTVVVAGLAGGLRAIVVPPLPSPSPGPTERPTDEPSPGPTPSDAPPTSVPTATGIVVAHTTDLERSGSARFRVPVTAPPPLPAGDSGLVVRLADGSFAAYDATCTHEGCRVGWNASLGLIVCPCHGAEFDPATHGAVVAGPTTVPLLELPLIVDVQSGTIALRT